MFNKIRLPGVDRSMAAKGLIVDRVAVRSAFVGVTLLFAVPAVAIVPVAPVQPDTPVAQVATPADRPLPETSFVPPTDRLAAPPSSLADGVRALAKSAAGEPWNVAWNAAWTSPGLTLREIARAAAAEPWLLPISLGGLGLIVAASYARRRQRRRIGWGVLPDRPARRGRAELQD